MTIIFFHGLGSSVKMLYKDDFIKQLNKIDAFFIAEVPYPNIYYYSDDKISKSIYKPIKYLNYDDLSLDKYISNLYNTIDKKKFKPPYILMGSSHGIYYAYEFARQRYKKDKKDIKYIISLDGSWISNKLNKKRLSDWKKKGKIIPKINNQKTLDYIMNKIILTTSNSKYIQMIFDYVRGTHTKFCIRQNYEKMNIPCITFRDFNSDVKDDIIMKQFNENTLEENKILSSYTNHIIYTLLDASHFVWEKDNYKNTIIQTIKLLI